MTKVQRRVTRAYVSPPPWTFRSRFKDGRTCLTHYVDPVWVNYHGKKLRAGEVDLALRLYRHAGVTKNVRQVIDGVTYVMYYKEEWDMLKGLDWIEFVDQDRECVYHLRLSEARRYVRQLDNRWGIPLDYYEES